MGPVMMAAAFVAGALMAIAADRILRPESAAIGVSGKMPVAHAPRLGGVAFGAVGVSPGFLRFLRILVYNRRLGKGVRFA